MLRLVVWPILADVSEELTASTIIALIMEAISSYETSVNIYQTSRHNIPEDCRLHTRRRDNLKSHLK
jgi:hypothetical protein